MIFEAAWSSPRADEWEYLAEVTLTYRVVQVSKVRLNPYVRLLQTALSEAGIPCSTVEGLGLRHLPLAPGTVSILHLHWLELLYSAPTPARSEGRSSSPAQNAGRSSSPARNIRRLAAVLAGLAWAKAKGSKVVYTVHNLHPHEQAAPALTRVSNAALSVLVDAFHVHDEEAKIGAARVYGRPDRIHVVPHGSYVGAYPNDCTRQEARAKLGLAEDAFVYLCLGQIRRYKGIEDLIAAFKQVSARDCQLRLADGGTPFAPGGEDPTGEYQLMLAGRAHDPAYAKSLSELVKGQDDIHTWFHYVADAELQYSMNACDVCVLPYRDITTSGAAILAFSFGKPIIAPALGGFPELVADGRGIVYDPQRSDGLLCALQEARSRDMEAAGQKALAWAKEHEWRALAPRFIRIYESVLGTKSSRPAKTRRFDGESSSR